LNVSVRWLTAVVGVVGLALLLPAAGSADHIVTAATIDARLKARKSTDFWIAGNDRLNGGPGADRLVGGAGTNAYDAGPGADTVDARNGKRELVRCGSGRDTARVDRSDRVRDCEVVRRP
jgi:Ca2+-binding RTX toxin-like protein